MDQRVGTDEHGVEEAMTKAAMLVGDRAVRDAADSALRAAGYEAVRIDQTTTLRRDLRRGEFAVAVLDLGIEGVDFEEIMQRRNGWVLPAVIVIAVGLGEDAARRALAAGADDYVSVSSLKAELAVRLEAATRRRASQGLEARLGGDACMLDRASSSLRHAGRSVGLTARELGIAQLMFEHVGEVVSRGMLADRLWGADEVLVGRTIDQHIYQLRRKLKRCAGDGAQLRSIYGLGYMMELSEQLVSRSTGEGL
jgi:DNA-binding response OmpR family regulator